VENERSEASETREMIICRDVHKWFGDFHVLRGVRKINSHSHHQPPGRAPEGRYHRGRD
jgi:hypothetical protein